MTTSVVLTLTGPDRVGIVEEITKALLGVGANVETSRMSRLGGEFAVLMLVTVPEGLADQIESSLAPLTGQGYKLTSVVTREAHGEARAAWQSFRVDVRGADHEGIIHGIAAGLAQQGISIESAETGTTQAPISGTPLFTMTAVVSVPPEVAEQEWREALAEVASISNVDIEVTAT